MSEKVIVIGSGPAGLTAALYAARGCELRVLVDRPGLHAVEEDYLLRPAVNFEIELFGPESVNELAVAVKHHHVRLDEVCADAHDLLVVLLRRRRVLRMHAKDGRERA